MDALAIGKRADKPGVYIETIRYYERRGLIRKPIRKHFGYRHYLRKTVTRIRFIRHAQELNFSIHEIFGLLSLRLDKKMPCSEVKKRAESKIKDIEAKILILKKLK